MQHVKEWFAGVAEVISAGGDNHRTLILAVLILLAALGTYFFRADRAIYKAGVFVVLALLVALVCFQILVGIAPLPRPAETKAEASTQAVASPMPKSAVAPEPSEPAEAQPDPETRLRWAKLNPAIYGDEVHLGMTEADLRAVLESDLDKEVIELGEVLALDEEKAAEALVHERHFDGVDAAGSNAFLIEDDIVIGAATSLGCVGSQDDCAPQCATARQVIRRAFAEEGVYPAWSAVEVIDGRNERIARRELSGIYLAFAGEFSSGDALLEEGNDFACMLTSITVDWKWALSG